MQYLALLYGGIIDKTGKQRIFATSGSCTAMIRRAWGGNHLLGEGEKVRDDHRHHAIDALTIALTTPEMVKTIASMTPEQRRSKTKDSKDTIIDNEIFRQASADLDNIPVSHHAVNKIRGAFHKETIYGKNYGEDIRHKRIKLSDLTADDVPHIVDSTVRGRILDRIGMTEKELKDWKGSGKDFQSRLDVSRPLLFQDKKGQTVNVIKAVRVAKKVTARTIGSGDSLRNVATGSNYLLAIFAVLDEQGNETAWEGEIVTLMDARYRLTHKMPLFEKNRPGRKFKFTLKKGDIVRFKKDGSEYLCIIRGVSLPQFYCCPVNDARKKSELRSANVLFPPYISSAFKWGMTKYQMNVFGELRRAND